MLHVYLAGAVRGTHGGWRDRIPRIDNVCFLHPGAAIPGPDPERRTELYGPADRLAVKRCDVLLAYCDRIEAGHGTAVEIGMAVALGKEVMIVCPSEETRYVWRFAVGCTPTVYSRLEDAIDVIRYAAGQVSGTARCAAT
ncbi:Nucleoside 2-deoxyribosyltransferase [Phycisphaerae bacterium RAS1]|nr:Nucleoside 2-deoxyribosyltransferase [Phycisphaerae bacterium RAS1]